MTRPTVPDRSRGFTLLEALIAGAIFFVSVVAISILSVQGANNASRGMRQAQASRVATQEMELWSMRGYDGLRQLLTDAGVSTFTETRTVPEQPDGGGRQYIVNTTIVDSSGAPAAPPSPNLGAPSYFINIQVTSVVQGMPQPITITQATYVSPAS